MSRGKWSDSTEGDYPVAVIEKAEKLYKKTKESYSCCCSGYGWVDAGCKIHGLVSRWPINLKSHATNTEAYGYGRKYRRTPGGPGVNA